MVVPEVAMADAAAVIPAEPPEVVKKPRYTTRSKKYNKLEDKDYMRIVEASKKTRAEYHEALNVLKVNPGTAATIVRRYHKRGFAEPKKQGGPRTRWTDEQDEFLDDFLTYEPQKTGEELTKIINESFPTNQFKKSSIFEKIHGLNFTYKRMHYVPHEANTPGNKQNRMDYAIWKNLETCAANAFVFVDESGINMRCLTPYGWGKVGKTPVAECVNSKTHNVSMIMGISPEIGLVHYEIEDDNVDGVRFDLFMVNLINAINSNVLFNGFAKIYIVLDGANIHTTKDVEDTFAGVDKIKGRVLPAFSPFLNPIEEVWSMVKSHMKKGIGKRQQEASAAEAKIALYRRIVHEEIGKAMLLIDKASIVNFDTHARSFLPACLMRQDVMLKRRPGDIVVPDVEEVKDAGAVAYYERPRRIGTQKDYTFEDPASVRSQTKKLRTTKRKINDTASKRLVRARVAEEDEDDDER